MNTEIYYCWLEIACKGMFPTYLWYSNLTDYIYQIQHSAMLGFPSQHHKLQNWLVSLKDAGPWACKQIDYINVMVCLGYFNLIFAKHTLLWPSHYSRSPPKQAWVSACILQACLHAYWAKMLLTAPKLPHPWSPILLYMLTSWGLLFSVLGFFVCLFSL